MTNPRAKDHVAKHLKQVGFLCTQWAYLEWLLEIAIWRFLDLAEAEGRKRTGAMPIGSLARDARVLAHRKLTNRAELDAFAEATERLEANIDERNLAVHGVRFVKPDESVIATMSRGPNKYQPQSITLIRLQILNDEVARIIDVIEPLLASHGFIDVSGPTGGERAG